MVLSIALKRQLSVLLSALLASCLVVAEDNKNNPLLLDNHFSRGVRITPPANIRFGFLPQNVTREAAVCLPHRDCSQQPVWQLQQWSNAQDIADAVETQLAWLLHDSDGRIQKRLQLKPGDPVMADVMLEMNGLSEFAARSEDGVPRYIADLGKPWPHWLLSQRLNSGRLVQYRQLMLSGQIRMLFDTPQHQEGYNPSVHAARMLLAITVRNRLTGDYFWLTLPLYDDRFPHSDFGCQKCTESGDQCVTPRSIADAGIWRCPEDRVGERWWHNEKPGTARMIFRMPTRDFLHGDPVKGSWVHVHGDLLPFVQAGIQAVRQRENGRRFPADLFFYELGLFSIGWEITGFNHVASQLRDWQLDAVR